jgi:hypothetical protein
LRRQRKHKFSWCFDIPEAFSVLEVRLDSLCNSASRIAAAHPVLSQKQATGSLNISISD